MDNTPNQEEGKKTMKTTKVTTVKTEDLAFICDLARKATGAMTPMEKKTAETKIDSAEFDLFARRFSFTIFATAIVKSESVEEAEALLHRHLGVFVDAQGMLAPEDRENGVSIHPLLMHSIALDPG